MPVQIPLLRGSPDLGDSCALPHQLGGLSFSYEPAERHVRLPSHVDCGRSVLGPYRPALIAGQRTRSSLTRTPALIEPLDQLENSASDGAPWPFR